MAGGDPPRIARVGVVDAGSCGSDTAALRVGALHGTARDRDGSAIRVFYGNDDFPAAPPPRCANWADRPFLVLVATAARFTHPGGIAGLRKRVAAISRLGGVRYWSTTRKIWRELFVEARALSSASPVAGRTDFHPTRIASGAVLFFWVNERSPIGEMVYRVRILQTEDHVLSFVMDNFLPVRFLFQDILAKGDLRTAVTN